MLKAPPTSMRPEIKAAATLMKLLAHPVRLAILCNLIHRGTMNVGELVEAEKGRVGQSQISQFLAKMRAEGLVQSRKDGQIVYYSIKSAAAQQVIATLNELYCQK